MPKPTVTVGIPAYNENTNIGLLLKTLMSQSVSGFVLKKIVVAADGCTDGTESTVRRLGSPLVVLIRGRRRLGKAARLNRIMATTNSDILVLLDGDIFIKDRHFLSRLTSPIRNRRPADLVSCPIRPVKPKTRFEKAVYDSMQVKNRIFDKLENGDNIYTCHGPVRAMSRRFYRRLVIPPVLGEDAFTYLVAKQNGYRYRYVKTTAVWYKLPNRLKDHLSQSYRFFRSQNELVGRMEAGFVRKHYRLPLSARLKLLSGLVLHPVSAFVYLPLIAYFGIKAGMAAQKGQPASNLWITAESSKNLNPNHA